MRGIVLGEGGADPRRDDAVLGLARMGHGVAHEMHPRDHCHVAPRTLVMAAFSLSLRIERVEMPWI